MAAYDKQFLDNTGLNTTVNALWTKLKKVTPYYSEKGTDGTNGWVKFLTVRCQQYMNQPLVVHLISRGYSYSTMEIQWVSSGGSTPTVSGFYHIIRSFNGTDGKSTNVGYTYEDIDSVRYYHFWKQKNEAYGILHVSVDGISKYISGSDDTGYLTFPNEHSTTEPTGIVYATEVWETVPKQTALSAKGTATKVPQITTNAYGQVTGITEVDITGVPPASHTHGSITNDGKIGTTANLPVITGTGGAVTTGSFSTTASAVGTSSAAGTANTFSRGDHVHSISLATGDSDGQVKIAGSNVSVAGWANKVSKFSLGSVSTSATYTMFNRMPIANASGNGEVQVLVSSVGRYGNANQGTWLISMSNRGSSASTPKASMTVRMLNKYSNEETADTVSFGYYYDTANSYIYFGVYAPRYRGVCNIVILSNEQGTLQDFGDTTTAPTGWTTVTTKGVSSAVKLDTSRTIRTDLSSTSTASFDGTANITPGVTGTLAIGHGGTSGTTTTEARYNLLADMNSATTDISDTQPFVIKYGTPDTSNGAIFTKPASKIWDYINGKLTSVSGVNISGNAATATSADLTRTADTTNGDKLQIGSGTAVNVVNSKHAASADTATNYDTSTGTIRKNVQNTIGWDGYISYSSANPDLMAIKSALGTLSLCNAKVSIKVYEFTSGAESNATLVWDSTAATGTVKSNYENGLETGTLYTTTAGKCVRIDYNGAYGGGYLYLRALGVFMTPKTADGTHKANAYLKVGGTTYSTYEIDTYGSLVTAVYYASNTTAASLYFVPQTSAVQMRFYGFRCLNNYEKDDRILIGKSSSTAKLATARTIQTNLGSTSTASFDGSANVTPGVTGTLAIGNGGTGATTAANARTNLSVYSKSEVDSMLTGRISVVASLPATGEPGVIYFVGPTGSGADQYEEYIWDGSAFIKVGEKSLDLSNYVNTLSSSGTGSVVTSLSKSGNTLTANLGNIAINNLSDWAAKSDVTISSVSYHVWWPTAPTSSNQVYGLSMKDGKLYQIYNNKGTYTARPYDQDTTYTNVKLGQGYGTCTTAAATAAKTATMTDYALTVGGIVAIKFTNALCASATLSINSKTAKPIYIKGAAVTADNAAAVSAGDLAYFMYDGTAYHLMGTDRAATNPIVNITRSGTTFTATRLDGSTFTFTQQDNNTTYTQEKLGQGYGTCSTAEATAAKVVALTDYELVKNGVVAIKFTYGLCASATLNINSKGAKPVFINGAAATSTTCKEVQAGDIALFIYDGTQYHFLVSDRVSKSAITGLSISGKTITYTRADASTGTITTQDTTYSFADSYDASTNKGATVATVTNAINALDVSDISGFGAGKTLATLTETNGKIAATFQNISITKSQVSDFSHTHGNITNGGTLQTTDITIADGDKLVVTDASDSNKVARASLTFDGATTNQMLSKKGDWSDTIAKARAVVDYGATSKAIEIGWSGAAVTSPAYFAVYTDSANGYNKAIKDCSLANVKKAVNGTSKGSSTQPTYIDANGVPTAIDYTIESNVPSGAVFTDTKQNITLATTTKAYVTGVSTTPTSTAQALTGLADTGVYLTTTAGELNATQYKVNEHCTMKYNSTKSSLDFTFS